LSCILSIIKLSNDVTVSTQNLYIKLIHCSLLKDSKITQTGMTMDYESLYTRL